MLGEKSVSGLGLQRCQLQGLSRFRDDKRRPDGQNVAASEKRKFRKKMSGRKCRPDKQQATVRAVKFQRCRGQTASKESGIIPQDDEREEMSRRKDSKD